MNFFRKYNKLFIKPVLFVSLASFVFGFGVVRCSGEVDAQAQTTPQIVVQK